MVCKTDRWNLVCGSGSKTSRTGLWPVEPVESLLGTGQEACPTLEGKPESHLNLPHLARANDVSEQAEVVQRTVRIAQVHQIKRVGELSPRLQGHPLAYLKTSRDGEIHVLSSRSG